MRKIYTLVGGLALALTGFTANAATLNDAVVVDGLYGNYSCYEWGASSMYLQYLSSDGVAQEITLVNPDNTTAQLTVPGVTTPFTVSVETFNLSRGNNDGIVTMDDSDYAADALVINISEAYWENDYFLPPGQYKLVLDAGILTSGGDTNPAQTITWTNFATSALIYDSMISPNPENSELGYNGVYAAEDLSNVTITFDETLTPLAGEITYEDADYTQYTLSSDNYKVAGNTITLDLSNLPEGRYEFKIPQGYVLVGDDSFNGGKTFTYIVWNGLPEGTVVAGPASVCSYVPNIMLTWNETVTGAASTFPNIPVYEGWYSEWADPSFYIPGENLSVENISYVIDEAAGTTADLCVLLIKTVADGTSLFNEKTGTFIIAIPEGLVKSGDKVNFGQQIEFALFPAVPAEPAVTLATNILSLVWDGYSVDFGYPQPQAYVRTADGEVEINTIYNDGIVAPNEDYDGIEINLAQFAANDGDYLLVLPEGYLNVDDRANDEWYISAEFTQSFTVEDGVITLTEGVEPPAETTELPTGTLNGNVYGGYMCSQYGVTDLGLQYLVDGVAATIELANPNVQEVEGSDEPFVYNTAVMTTPDGKTQEVNLVINFNVPEVMDTEEGEEEPDYSGNELTIQLSALDYTWPAGKYSVAIPAGVVKTAENAVNPAQTVEFTMVNNYALIYDANMDPQPRDLSEGVSGMYSQTDLAAVTISFEAEVALLAGDITYSQGNGEAEVLDSKNVKVDGKNLVLDLSGLTQGTYSFDIPTGYLLVGGNSLSGAKNFTYVVWNGLPEAEMIQGPAETGVYVRNIELSWGVDVKMVGTAFPAFNVYEDWYDASAKPAFTIPAANISLQEVTAGEGGTPSTGGESEGETTTMTVLYLDIEELFEGLTGTYVIEVPEGIVTYNNLVNPAQTIQFTLTQVVEAEPVYSLSADGVLSITWNNAVYVGYNENLVPYLETPAGEKLDLTWGEEINPTLDYNGVLVNVSSLLSADGEYAIVIPQGYLSISFEDSTLDGINAEIVYAFDNNNGETTGVNTIGAALQVRQGVYNLQGVKVANDAASMKNLPAGLYIIDGKKVMIRK